MDGDSRETLGLSGEETFSVRGIAEGLSPGKLLQVDAVGQAGAHRSFTVVTRIDTGVELDYYRHGGILEYVLRELVATARA